MHIADVNHSQCAQKIQVRKILVDHLRTEQSVQRVFDCHLLLLFFVWFVVVCYYVVIRISCLHPGLQQSEEHTSELQSRENLVCRLLLEKNKLKSDKSTEDGLR